MLDERALAFISGSGNAAMTTLRRDGSPHTVRVGVGVIDGKVWSSGTQTRVRTRHLRRDARASLFVFDAEWRWLTLECTVTILEGPDAPQLHVRLFEQMQSRLPNPPRPGHLMWFGQEKTVEEFLRLMVEERRLIYQFEVVRQYGMY